MRVAIAAVAVVMCCTLTMNTAAAQGRVSCDRTCLTELLDRYLDALVARDPSRLPLARTVKFTENGQRLDLGDGLWHTVTGKGSYRLDMADVEAGQAVLMGTIREAETPAIIVLRLGVVEQRIAEIETLVIRNKDAAENLDKIATPRRAWYTAVPEGERHSRADLVRVANMYFSGIQLNDGKGEYPLRESCARLENGSVTAGDPALVPGAPPTPPNRSRSSCLQQFQSGVFFYVTRIRDRRFVAIDRARGIAFAFAFFDNGSGDARNGTLSDGRKVSSGPSTPWTWQIAEFFKIEKGLIGPVESVLHPVPYGMGSGWSTWEDSMSSRPRWQ
ncbi:MAG TPA: hypothetical protein VFB92_03250 [Vicinamibacterales bacterium]|jgi:hypothetical protein|nr:hypothetical protein [Vicinamibacterales bacterium]